jgi:hypothetical protein
LLCPVLASVRPSYPLSPGKLQFTNTSSHPFCLVSPCLTKAFLQFLKQDSYLNQYHFLNPFASVCSFALNSHIPFTSPAPSRFQNANSSTRNDSKFNEMLPINNYQSPFRAFSSLSSGPGNFHSPLHHLSPFTSAQESDAELENILLRRELAQCPFHSCLPINSPFNSPFGQFQDREARHIPRCLCNNQPIFTPSSLHIRLRALVASTCPNGTLHIRHEFVATIPISATIANVYSHLVRELERSLQGIGSLRLQATRVEVRVCFIDGRCERLALFRDVLDLREERGVEGCVVVVEW